MISDPWIDRSPRPRILPSGYLTPYHQRKKQVARRDALRALGKCICGPVVGNVGRSGVVHGPPIRLGRCERCLVAYAESK